MTRVPTIDLASYRAGRERAATLGAVDAACRDHGFFLLRNHGADDALAPMWTAAEQFFAAPRAVKRSVMRDADNSLGYYDRELTKQKRDQKEVFDFKAGGKLSSRPERQTRWPEGRGSFDGAEFKSALTTYFEAMTALSAEVLALVYAGLGLPRVEVRAAIERDFGAVHTSAARLNCYPSEDPLAETERRSVNALGDMALHHHTDPGAVTLLAQDAVGGLQALSRDAGWIDVPPAAGTLVVNLGDVLQVWTNDHYVAATHRVLPVAAGRTRFSTPFFYQPRGDAVIEPWPALAGGGARYRAFTWREFIFGRVSDNYEAVGDGDIQISRYRVA